MTKPKALYFVSLLLTAITLTYAWVRMIISDIVPQWQHYLTLLLFGVLVFLCFRSFAKAVVGLGTYLLLATFDLLWIVAGNYYQTHLIKIGSLQLSSPPIQPMALLLLVVYGALNFNTLIEIYLDYKEAKNKPRI